MLLEVVGNKLSKYTAKCDQFTAQNSFNVNTRTHHIVSYKMPTMNNLKLGVGKLTIILKKNCNDYKFNWQIAIKSHQ